MTDILQEKENETGENSNRTKIYRFSYNSGKIEKYSLKDRSKLNELKAKNEE